jgi:hypothetical protein
VITQHLPTIEQCAKYDLVIILENCQNERSINMNPAQYVGILILVIIGASLLYFVKLIKEEENNDK